MIIFKHTLENNNCLVFQFLEINFKTPKHEITFFIIYRLFILASAPTIHDLELLIIHLLVFVQIIFYLSF